MRRDDFTATVSGAAAYERTHGDHYDPYDDRPTLAEAEADAEEDTRSPAQIELDVHEAGWCGDRCRLCGGGAA